ncbi:hypothetical protein FSP39_025053 [Pinctada imbricata]|uniref:Uncharacterized protein n=1 Tax=Pinctada imbricata TaxID=66713 RepID=A0AA88XUR0_PINIB|nr:hypothetical protein FSP39_025053 [Pinctada imbricata]
MICVYTHSKHTPGIVGRRGISNESIVNTIYSSSDFKKAFSFRTCSTNGQLLHQRGGSGDYFSVSVINGSLDVRWRAGSTEEVLAIGSNLYNNRWYYVNIFTILGSTRLEVNLGSNLLASDVLGNGTYRTSLWRADLRGSGDLTVGSHFTGCIQQGPGVTFENNNAIQPIGVSWSNTSCPIDGVTCNSDDNTQTFCWSSPCRHGGTCREEGNTYSCQCPHLYNGTNCDNYLGVLGCTVSPCLNNGSCVDQNSGSNNYQCNCLPGFNGFNCEVDINECGQNPCNNGGRCIDGINSFTCNCTGTGYQGNTCSVNIDECNPISPCQNGGTCFDTQGSYDCQCPAGYQDKNCQEVNECLSQPCKNGGSCNDQLNAYTCDCVQGFTDPDCNTNIDDCQGVVCPGNFTQCQDGVNMHTCVCKPGYTGVAPVCTEVQECSSNPCKNGASCIDRINRYECQCLQGFNGTNCENNIDNCLPNPCRNNASCQDLVDNYTCSCLPGYTGKNCSQDINECSSNPCSNGATCRNLLNQFQCDCVPGWTGTLCETDIDECSSNPCKNGATCQQSLDRYTCTCLPGFTGDNCETDINDCSPNPCENGGSCIDKVNGYECQCTADWMGKNCSVQYNACSFAPCKNGATCMTEPPKHDYNCTCVPGFQDANCSTNIDDCASAPCTAPFVCFDGVNNHTCACPTGYTGVNCSEEIMECESNPCQNGGTCIDQVGNYTCVCLQSITNLTRYVSYQGVFVTGYKGRNCEQDIDECTYPNPICLNGGKCENSDGDYKCYCGGNHGDGSYTLGHNCELSTTYCQVAEEAKLDPPACHNGGNCTAGDDTFTCTCAAGYTGRRCKIDIDECASDPCQYNGTCNDHVAHFTCDCIPGITGETCDTDIDECASNPCKNEGQCKDYINGYECNCTDTGFNGTTCENNIDDCASSPCQHGSTCTDLIKDYNCTCYLGYTGKNCEMDIDECASSPCQYNGTCLEHSKLDTYTVLNSLGEFSYANASGYSCQCIKGITGANCEINIDDCVNNTCEHGSTCKDLIDDYMCQCAPGYKGDMCEIDIDECELNACKNDATCTDRVADYDCTCSNVKNSQGQLFSGKNCTFELTACYPESNPRCQNGAICHPFLVNEARGEQGYTCECQPGLQVLTVKSLRLVPLMGPDRQLQAVLVRPLTIPYPSGLEPLCLTLFCLYGRVLHPAGCFYI